MFGKKRIEEVANGLLDIMSVSNKNVLILQETVGILQETVQHLGTVIGDMHTLIEIQEARLSLLEGAHHDRRNNET